MYKYLIVKRYFKNWKNVSILKNIINILSVEFPSSQTSYGLYDSFMLRVWTCVNFLNFSSNFNSFFAILFPKRGLKGA
jgi:hypothetical protein